MLESECGISSNWPLETNKTTHQKAYFVEINGKYAKLGLHSAITKIQHDFSRKMFLVGGYNGKCITDLLWSVPIKKNQKVNSNK